MGLQILQSSPFNKLLFVNHMLEGDKIQELSSVYVRPAASPTQQGPGREDSPGGKTARVWVT